MAFLKFLKKEKKKEDLSELDLPPAPPPLEGFEEEKPMQDITDFGDDKKFDFSMDKERFPELPDLEESSTSIPPLSSHRSAIPTPEEATSEVQEAYPKPRGRLFSHEKSYEPAATGEQTQGFDQIVKTGKTVYVRVEKFKLMLGTVNMVRNDLKNSDEALLKLENIKNSTDRSFEKVRSSLTDLQKKLIFIDKTLFEGEKNERA